MLVKIYTDGSARGNPDGPGGYGTILSYTDPRGQEHIREYSQGYRKTTNNRMELMAAIVGLEALNRPCQVELYSDSRYLVDAFNQHWIESWIKKNWVNSQKKPVKNPDLWKRLLKAVEPHEVTFIWVKGHDGHPQNERCDELATRAATTKTTTTTGRYRDRLKTGDGTARRPYQRRGVRMRSAYSSAGRLGSRTEAASIRSETDSGRMVMVYPSRLHRVWRT